MKILNSLSDIKVFIIFLIVGFCVFGNSLLNGFVGDEFVVLYNQHVTMPLPMAFLTFLQSQVDTTNPHSILGQYYRPLPLFYFSFIKHVFGLTPFFLRTPILILHICNAFILYIFFKRFFSKKIAFASALIFLVHPLNQEAVVYIAVAQEVFYFFFGGLAMLIITSPNRSIRKNLLASILFLLSFLSKESGILFFFASMLYLFFFVKKEIIKKIPYLLLPLLMYLPMRFLASQNNVIYIVKSNISSLHFFDRMVAVPKIFFFYLSYFIYPRNVSILPKWVVEKVDIENFYVPLVLDFLCITLFILAYFIFIRKSRKLKVIYIFFAVIFIIGIGLHLQIKALDQTVAARWFYFPMIGLLGILSTLVEYFKKYILLYKKLFLITFILILIFFAGKTFTRNLDFKDALTLYTKDVNLPGENYYLENNIGDQLAQQGKYDLAIIHFKKSIKINPKWYIAYSNLGIVYEQKKDYEKAEKYLQYAIVGKFLPAYENLARIYLLHKSPNKARDFTLLALKEFPKSETLWLTLSLSYYELGEYSLALPPALTSYQLFPQEKTAVVIQAIRERIK
ncbi:MAG: tetratricopeptide repeat protein [Candidatus Levybacteria bacterium]|nr:tetratricopeptide repeat protein [Candidatus Levybacteria bacterium]